MQDIKQIPRRITNTGDTKEGGDGYLPQSTAIAASPAMSNPARQLLSREVSRKDFLKLCGFGLVSLMGLSSIIKLLSGMSDTHGQLRHMDTGYSSSFYGGARK